ncbi:hypothetical protein V8D89_006094, partial [Ganoderma adspersum]
MATAFIEEALSPGSSTHRSRMVEPNVRLPQPILQLEPSSFVGCTLRGLSKGKPSSSDDSSSSESSDSPLRAGPLKQRHAKRPESSFSSSSSSSKEPSSSGGLSSSDSSSSSSGSSRSSARSCHHHHRKYRASRKRRSSKKCSKHSKLHVPVLKPLDPDPYEGEADLPTFHRFIGQMSDHLEGYRVRSRNHPSVVARFLRGRAHEFYINTISRNPRAYRFKDILVGLFNYCFPMNFHQKMREKLRNTRQHGRSIQSYSYEMENLFLILSIDQNEERMDVFWFGLDKYIQSELWKQMMTLKSPYEDVKAKAQQVGCALSMSLNTGMVVRSVITTLPQLRQHSLLRLNLDTMTGLLVRSDNRDHAPGVATYNIEVAIDDAEALRSLAESTSATTELHLHSVEFDYGSLPFLQPTWELLEPDFRVDYLTGMVSISKADDSGIDLGDTEWDDIPSLQTVSDTNSELDSTDENWSASSDSMPGLQPCTDLTSSDGGGCAISFEDNGILVQGFDWEVLQLPRT